MYNKRNNCLKKGVVIVKLNVFVPCAFGKTLGSYNVLVFSGCARYNIPH